MKTIIFIIGKKKGLNLKLSQFFEQQGYKCLFTESADELDQSGKQLGKLIMVFSELEYAKAFLTENRWSGFHTLRLLILPPPTIVLQKFNSEHILSMHSTTNMGKVLKEIKEFLDTDFEAFIDNLEFSAQNPEDE